MNDKNKTLKILGPRTWVHEGTFRFSSRTSLGYLLTFCPRTIVYQFYTVALHKNNF